ncbi:unnamed protein product [Prunus armeniaca]|uniref:Uncharacterized protein n=1 Tax=Prunus armeniaca TaxID=36596 RepID=A0A6J5USK9_PRUAR|nr:unnamed protein product [Prunus armeniaca]CAB4310002.1 unnamed protein product [Prunus armeniaca]
MKRRLSNEEDDQMNEPIRTIAATNEINGRKKARSSFNSEALMGERASQNWELRFPRRDENMAGRHNGQFTAQKSAQGSRPSLKRGKTVSSLFLSYSL